MLNLKRRISLFTLLIAFAMGLMSCSEKAEFSERPYGEDYLTGNGDVIVDGSSDCPSCVQSRFISERFQQSKKTMLDVLWIIDNSASMAPYQDMLAENIDSFLNVAASWDADIQMGVTSTDMCTAKRPTDLSKIMCPDKAETIPGLGGKLQDGKVVRAGEPTDREDFARLARLGTMGSSFEHGLSAAKSAVQLSLAGENSGLLREDSFLSVVIVSDEEDDGIGLSKSNEEGRNWWAEGKTRYRFTADDLIAYMNAVRPNGKFSVSSVVGFTRESMGAGPCGDNGSLEPGTEQLRATTLSGGFKLDICSSDWGTGLSAMAENFASQVSSFRLRQSPIDHRSIEVLVDGLLRTNGWVYVESRQSIVFDPSDIPPFGSVIEVRYSFR